MSYASRVPALALGMFLALPCAGIYFAGAELQEPPQGEPGSQTKTTLDSTANKAKPSQDDSKPPPKPGEKQSGTTSSGQAVAAKKDVVAASGTDKKAKPASQPSFHDLAKENLQNFDVAIDFNQKMGFAAPATWQDKSTHDPLLAKKSALHERAEAAKDEQAWALVANDSATALNDLLAAMAANPTHAAPSDKPAAMPVGEPRQGAGPVELPSPFSRSNLALSLAILSLLVSVLALWRGWFLARRETNKALAEAGLL
jgi:hypothetical protein